MCVAAIAWQSHPDWPLVVAGNRDEFHARASAPLARWDDGSGILAGRDLVGGGTWMGLREARDGETTARFVLVTNYRVAQGAQPGRPSRGILVTDLLAGRPTEAIETMNPFNLVEVADGGLRFLTNHPTPETRPLLPGIHGLSNGGFDLPWPKTRAVERAVRAWLDDAKGHAPSLEPLLAALRDETAWQPDPAGHAPEAKFAPVFIRDEIYGTRCSTVIALHRHGHGRILERSFGASGEPLDQVSAIFSWPPREKAAHEK